MTIHHDMLDNLGQRMPRVRFGKVNVYNLVAAYYAANDPDLVGTVGWTPPYSTELMETPRVVPAVESGAGVFNW